MTSICCRHGIRMMRIKLSFIAGIGISYTGQPILSGFHGHSTKRLSWLQKLLG